MSTVYTFKDLLRKDRQYNLSQKLNDDLSRRLRLSYAECEKVKKELEQERLIFSSTERDLNILKVEMHEIQHSERQIREERSRWLQVSDLMRCRILSSLLDLI